MFEKMRDRWTKAINPLVHRMEGVDPSLLTWTSLILSILAFYLLMTCLLYTSPSPRDVEESRMPSSA